MAVGRYLEGVFVPRRAVPVHIQHVRQQESRAFLLYGVRQITKGRTYVGSVRFRFQLDDFPDDMEQMAASFFRRDELLHLIAEKKCTHLIVIDDGRKREYGCNLRYQIVLGHSGRPEQTGAADIDQQDNGEFPFLFKDLHIRRSQTRGDIPVHIAHIVPILVLAHFTESHSASLESGVVLSGENLVGKGTSPDLYLPDLLEQVVCTSAFHYGTSTALIISAMIFSVVTFSASAS